MNGSIMGHVDARVQEKETKRRSEYVMTERLTNAQKWKQSELYLVVRLVPLTDIVVRQL